MRNQRGIAIIMVLLISVILFVIGLSFSIIVEREYRIAGESEKMDRAEYMADAGLQMTLAGIENAVKSGSTDFTQPWNVPTSSFWNTINNIPMNIDGYTGFVTVGMDFNRMMRYDSGTNKTIAFNPNDPRQPPRNGYAKYNLPLSNGNTLGIDYVCLQERKMKQVTYTYLVTEVVGSDDDGNPIYGDVTYTSASQYPAYMPGYQYLYEIYVKATAYLFKSDGSLEGSKTIYGTITVNTCPLYKDAGGNDKSRTRYTTLRIWNERK